MTAKNEVKVLARSSRGHAKYATAEKHMEAAMRKWPEANVGDVWQDNCDEGRWHWYVGIEDDEVQS